MKKGELTGERLEELRGALDAEKDAVEEEMAAHGKIVNKGWEGSSESVGEEADPADAADNIEELVVNVPLVAELEKRHKDIGDALEKMDKGTYGICEVSGEPIPFKRLEADPAARTLVEYA
jgi:RNA polymerase-binding transcription factor DksA